ncbi:YqaJ viral recombinase family protein [Glutamicibacter soli]
MSIKIYKELEQGSDEWLQARAGLVTASTIGLLISTRTLGAIEYDCPECDGLAGGACQSKPNKDGETRDLKAMHTARAEVAREKDKQVLVPAFGDTAMSLTKALTAERITGHVEPSPTSRAMERGTLDEPFAREHYAEHYAPVTEIGFMTRTFKGFTLGYSPDGLVGEDGLIEIKSRSQKKQLEAFLTDEVPAENMAQLQTGLLVKNAAWIDYVSYCGGMPLFVKRVYPDPAWQKVIIQAAGRFESLATNMASAYLEKTAGLPLTERIDHFADMEVW